MKGGHGYRRGAARLLAVGALAFAALALWVLARRQEPPAYVPGQERETSAEITRALERRLPAQPEAGPNPGAPRATLGADAGGTRPGAESPAGVSFSPAGVSFSERAEAAGLRFRHFHGRRSSQLPEDMGSGLAWGDYDGDGDPDLFLVNESGPLTLSAEEAERSPARAALYRNNGDGTFSDVTDAAGLGVRGLGQGAAWGDYDGDGDLDLVVTRYGTNLLFRNDGGRFQDVSRAAGLGGLEGFWAGASWADYDRDGDLDLYVCGYVRYAWDAAAAKATSLQFRAVVPYTLNPSSYPPERNLLFRNEGGRFREVARAAGVDNPGGRSLSAAWADFDFDGWPDLYVANDVSDNALFHNRGDGSFADISHSAWVADYRGAMGLGIGDWDGDGDFDIFVTHWIAQENALYADESANMKVTPEAPLRFVDQADVMGVGQIALDAVGWGTGFFDYDNDGRLDIFAANGSTFQVESDPEKLIPMRNFLFWNAGPNGYYEVGHKSGAVFDVLNVARGAAFADYDGDGDLDVAVVVHGGALRLLRNEGGHARAWARVVLRSPAGTAAGAPYRSTTWATGALVRLTAGGLTQVRAVGGQPSYLSQEPPGEVFFGLGESETVERLEVRWPSGRTQTFTGLAARASLHLDEGGTVRVEARR